jgi:hypothetical protein
MANASSRRSRKARSTSSRRALEAFVLANLRFPGEIEGELYEDKYVGDTLWKEGIALRGIDVRTIGLAPFPGSD